MRIFRKLLAAFLIVLVISTAAVSAHAVSRSAYSYVQQIINYYRHYQNRAQGEIDDLLLQLEDADPTQAKAWKQIMYDWDWIYNRMPIHYDVLPDGLPQDDSLCILVFGYQLKDDGSMRPELVSRLKVALASAEKYPNAYIACTGGPTGGSATEAQQMADWLRSHGISSHRIITENQSLSTTQNALYTYDILDQIYPQVNSIAIVSSDYHVRLCSLFMSTMATYSHHCNGGTFMEVVATAACHKVSTFRDTPNTQAHGVAALTGVDIDRLPTPKLHKQVGSDTTPSHMYFDEIIDYTGETVEETDPPVQIDSAEQTTPAAQQDYRKDIPASDSVTGSDSRLPAGIILTGLLVLILFWKPRKKENP